MKKLTDISQFESLASSSASYTASVAAVSSAAIRELAQVVPANAIVLGESTVEPDSNDYWFYIEEE